MNEPTLEQIEQRAQRLSEGVAQLEADTRAVAIKYGIEIEEDEG
jgi:hypothetical protein